MTDMQLADEGLEILDEGTCLALAATRPIGRVAVTVAALPAVFPVNHVIVGRDVYFRTGEGTKLAAASRHSVVAFQVDDFDTVAHAGWSVQIIGVADDATEDELGVAGFRLPVEAWARGRRERLVRITGDLITGRRIMTEAVAGIARW